MDENVVVAPSALKRPGISEDDVRHAYRNPFRLDTESHDGLTMRVGGDFSGRPLEIGFIESSDGVIVVVHAMPARPDYLR